MRGSGPRDGSSNLPGATTTFSRYLVRGAHRRAGGSSVLLFLVVVEGVVEALDPLGLRGCGFFTVRDGLIGPGDYSWLSVAWLSQNGEDGIIRYLFEQLGLRVTPNRWRASSIEAVIDKDLASARLAEEVGVDIFLIATDVPGVYTDFGGPTQVLLDELSLDRAETLAREGALGTGAMLPKVQACSQFIKNGGRQAVITDIDHIAAAVAGRAGTRFRI